MNGREYKEWFLSFLVDYYIFGLGWGYSEDRKTVPEFYKKIMDNVSLLDEREEIASDSQNDK